MAACLCSHFPDKEASAYLPLDGPLQWPFLKHPALPNGSISDSVGVSREWPESGDLGRACLRVPASSWICSPALGTVPNSGPN